MGSRKIKWFRRGLGVAGWALVGLLSACGEPPVQRVAQPYSPYASETYLSGSKDICMVTQFTSNQDSFASIAADNHQAYAWRHGYKSFSYRGRISGEQFVDADHPELLRRDGLYWQKIAATQQLLRREDPSTHKAACQWIMWLDADAIFTNFERSIETVLAPYEDKDVVLPREHFDTLINAGVFFVKNSKLGHAFVDEVAAMFPAYKDKELPEQQAMQDYAFNMRVPKPHEGLFDQLLPRLRSEIAVVHQRQFDSFAIPNMSWSALYTWKPCDFVAHLAAQKAESRVQSMREMIDNRPVCDP